MISFEPLRNLMGYRNITIKELKEQGEFSSATLAKIGKDLSVTTDTLDRLCEFFKVPANRIIKFVDVSGNEYDEDVYGNLELLRKLDSKTNEIEILKQSNKELKAYLDEQERVQRFENSTYQRNVDGANTFGGRVKEKRLKLGHSQMDLAKLCDVSPMTISLIESGAATNTKINTILNMCKLFECSIDWLVLGKETVR